MKRRSIYIVIAVIIILFMGVLFSTCNRRVNGIVDDYAYALYTVGVSDDMVISHKRINNSNVITVIDFETGQEMVLCSNLVCKHNDNNCFAFNLADEATCIIPAGDYLYYAVILYEPEEQKPYVLEFRKSSLDGSRTDVIGRYDSDEQTAYCYKGMLGDGYIAMVIESEYTEFFQESPAAGKANHVIIISIIDNTLKIMPEHRGFVNSVELLAIEKGILYYYHKYFTEPVDFFSDYAHISESFPNERTTVYEVDLKSATEKVWMEEHRDRHTYNGIAHEILVGLPNGLMIASPALTAAGSHTYSFTLQTWNKSTTRDVEVPGSFIASRNEGSYYALLLEYGEQWFSDYMIYDSISDTLYSLTPLVDYIVYGITKEKILLYNISDVETNGGGYDFVPLYYIFMDDIKEGRLGQLHSITMLH